MRIGWLGILRVLSALALSLLLAACGGGDGSGEAASGSAAVEHSKSGVASGAVVRGAGAPDHATVGGGVPPAAPASAVAQGVLGESVASSDAPRKPLPPHVPDEIIVRFRDRVPELNKAATLSRAAATRLRVFRTLEGLERHRLPANVTVDGALARYRKDPDVLYAEPNYIVRTASTPDDTRFGELWGLSNTGQSGGTPGADIDALAAWGITTGSSSVVVAVIDTGIDYNHPELSANMFRNASECIANGIDDDGNGRIDDCFGIDTAGNDSNPLDDNRHGSHVAGTIGAAANNAAGVAGISWNVSLMACKFLDAAGSGTTADAIECLEYVKSMKERGVNVVATNNSWGGGGFSQALFDAIQRHQEAGILFVAAAGNGNAFGVGRNNDQTPFYPCAYGLPNVICVAATTRTDDRATFSNYGRRTVHIGAPGNEILSTALNGSYATLNGTSMATPHVTGTAALLKAADPARDWRAIRNLILAGGDNVASMANTITQKRLNALGALTCSNSPVVARLRPVADAITSNAGTPVGLMVLNINCAVPNGEVVVTVNPGGETVTLLDDGAGPDQAAGDGNYSGQWTPTSAGSFTLAFPDGSELAVTVTMPVIGVAPNALDFGTINANVSSDRTFTVQNTGNGTLTGSASTAGPFAIVSGGTYSLAAGQSHTVTVRFSPTAEGIFSGTVSFTGGGGASKAVTGVALPPAVIAASPTTVNPGTAVTVNWSGIAAPSATDWIGIFAPGAPNTSIHLGWRYTTGTASGGVPFTIPITLAPGTYEFRLFSNNGYTRLAVGNITVVACTSGSLNASPANVPTGGSVTAAWSGVCVPAVNDWIGLYVPGAFDSSFLAYRYTTGTASGSVPFTIPAALGPGTYELRLFAGNGAVRLAVSNTITVAGGCTGGGLGASPTSVTAGGSVTVNWSGVCAPTSRDWIGLFAPGASNTSYLAWRYTTGTSSGSLPLTIPATLAPGAYELRLFLNGGYTQFAMTSITVGAGCTGGATLGASPASVAAGGPVTATWSGICTPAARDWIGIFAPGAADRAYVAWTYTNGAAAGSLQLAVPAGLAPGTYELRLYANNGYTRLGTSNAFVVTSP
jgi:subtilisin family serine protease